MLPPQLSLPASASAQRLQFAAAYSVLEQAVSEQAFPGAAFGVLVQGQVLALDAVGGFTYEPPTTPVTASTVYDLASITKVIATTSMAMLLYQNGALTLDQPLVQLLPGFAQGEAAGSARRQVTLRMLLAHASGLPGNMLVAVSAERLYGFDAPTRHSEPRALLFNLARAEVEAKVHQRVNVRLLELIDRESGDRIELEGNRLPLTHSGDVITALVD